MNPGPSQHTIRPGLVLSWGSNEEDHAPALNDREVAVWLRFELAAESASGADRMTLLRPAGQDLGGTPVGATTFCVRLALAEHSWNALLADDKTPGSAQARAFVADPGAHRIEIPLTPGARLAVESIRRCPFGGAFREMALTARCNDLLLEFFTALGATASSRPLTLLQTLELQVRGAAGMLAAQLDSPPTVAELARRVGTSETSLKRGFRQVFGTTVFGYLRERRMERAHAALQSGTVTVLEAAGLVGYSNPSNFATAFRRQFGVNPKQFQLAVRR